MRTNCKTFTCINCNAVVKINTKIDGKRVQLNHRKRCLTCHPYKSKIERSKIDYDPLTCERCSQPFQPFILQNGKRIYSYKRKFCYSCNPFRAKMGLRLLCEELLWKKKEDGTLMKRCSMCENFLDFNSDNFLTNRKKVSNCRHCENARNRERHQKRKQIWVDLKGGCCQVCGYDKYLGALEFHHNNPEEKDKDFYDLIRLSSPKVLEELDKCLLVCVNCHREIHGGLHQHLFKRILSNFT